MQHLKNITAGNPKTKEQYQLTKNFDVIWLWSEDGKNWYEELKNFQEDTIKILYDENNIIVAITKDASTLNPEGYSVVEVPDITANRRADDSGKWMFKDGAVVTDLYGRRAAATGRITKGRITFRSGKRYSATGARCQAEYGDG